jgi:hypothetical protein
MKWNRIVFFAAILMTVYCNKPDDLVSDGDVLVYYDYFAYTGQTFSSDSIDCSRVCYNLSNDQVVWIKPNEKVIKLSQISTPGDEPVARAFSKDDYIIKIFASSSIPDDYMRRPDAIYFQKISKRNGEQVLLKQIITGAELNATGSFFMSQVETDGNNFFFSCSNDYVYCFDGNGNQVWKKNYPSSNVYGIFSGGYDGYTHVYYNEGRVYLASIEPTLGWEAIYGLDAQNGQQVFFAFSFPDPLPKQLLFTKKHVVNFDRYGAVVNEKSTGNNVGQSAEDALFLVGQVNDTMVAFAGLNGKLRYINSNDAGRRYGNDAIDLDLAFFGYGRLDYTFSESLYYGGLFYSDVSIIGADLRYGSSQQLWTKSYPFGPIPGAGTANIHRKDNTIYSFNFFKIENNQVIPNRKTVNGQQNWFMSYIEINALTGSIGYQSGEIPTGRWVFRGPYNVLIE